MRIWLIRCIQDYDRRCRVGSILGLALLFGSLVYGRMLLAETPKKADWVLYAISSQEEDLVQNVLPAFEAAWEAGTNEDLLIESILTPSGMEAVQVSLETLAEMAESGNAQHVIVILGKSAPAGD